MLTATASAPAATAPLPTPVGGDATGGALLRAQVASIHRTKFREGYDIAEVDAFVERAAAALDGTGPALTPSEVLNEKFHATTFREGYDQDAVDDLLDQVVLSLRVRD